MDVILDCVWTVAAVIIAFVARDAVVTAVKSQRRIEEIDRDYFGLRAEIKRVEESLSAVTRDDVAALASTVYALEERQKQLTVMIGLGGGRDGKIDDRST